MIDQGEREMLERARRGLAPTAADTARVAQRLSFALGAISPPSSTDPVSPGAAAGPAPWVGKLAVAGAVAAVGALGYLAGHHAGVSEGLARAPSVPPIVVASTGMARNLSPGPIPPAAAAAAPEPAPVRLRTTSSSNASRASSAPSAASSSAAFDHEVIQLRRVQRALREGNPRLALVLLDDLDTAVPRGRLGEERAAARVIARCVLGAGPASVLAEDFAAAFPNSVYAARVKQACSAGIEKQ